MQAGTHADSPRAFAAAQPRSRAPAHHLPMDKHSFVYLLASRPYGTLYIGVTSDLARRVWEHREGMVAGFTKRYRVKELVWYELHDDIMAAITREKQLKEWQRAWKIELIQKTNPLWRDLFSEICG